MINESIKNFIESLAKYHAETRGRIQILTMR